MSGLIATLVAVYDSFNERSVNEAVMRRGAINLRKVWYANFFVAWSGVPFENLFLRPITLRADGAYRQIVPISIINILILKSAYRFYPLTF